MPSTATADPLRRLPRWRPLHGLLIVLALVAPLLVTTGLGGPDALAAVTRFPLALLVLMLLMAFACWNLNAARLRLMLDGRAGRLGQRGALSIELASKFALCATPGGSGGPALRCTAAPGARWLSSTRRRWLVRRLLTC
ncbi:MAG: lysylphosphatidylglycerol synthase domain-containing protein [Pseudomonadota bacterium]